MKKTNLILCSGLLMSGLVNAEILGVNGSIEVDNSGAELYFNGKHEVVNILKFTFRHTVDDDTDFKTFLENNLKTYNKYINIPLPTSSDTGASYGLSSSGYSPDYSDSRPINQISDTETVIYQPIYIRSKKNLNAQESKFCFKVENTQFDSCDLAEGTDTSFTVQTRQPRSFTLNDFTRSVSQGLWHTDPNDSTQSSIVHTREYHPNGFTLKRVWDENGFRLNGSNYRVLGSYWTKNGGHAYDRSTSTSSLYWIYDVYNKEVRLPFMNWEDGWYTRSMGKIISTQNTIVFGETHGGGEFKTMNANVYGAIIGNPDEKNPLTSRVHFEDTYGNSGFFSFSRLNRGDSRNNGYYNYFVSSAQ